MIIVMPLMIGYMATKFQVFICLYWFTFSILGVIQQIIVNRGLTPQSGAARKEKQAAEKTGEKDGKQAEQIAEKNEKQSQKGKKNTNTSKKKK